MAANPTWHTFHDPAELAERFADRVAAALRLAIEARGLALLCVSGGTTPGLFFRALSQRDLDWNRVTVAPVDERFVPPSSDRSNEKLIRANLLIDKAAQARFVGLYSDANDIEAAARAADTAIGTLALPFDVLVLGMGGDAHTASFFPDSPELGRAIDGQAAVNVMAVTARSAGEPRLTLTMPLVVSARLVAIHIEGDDKRAALDDALAAPSPMKKPISAVIAARQAPVDIYWAPKKG